MRLVIKKILITCLLLYLALIGLGILLIASVALSDSEIIGGVIFWLLPYFDGFGPPDFGFLLVVAGAIPVSVAFLIWQLSSGNRPAKNVAAVAVVMACLGFAMPHITNMIDPTQANLQDSSTTLVQAANMGNSELVKARIDDGADLEARSEIYGWTPLIHAAWAPSERSVTLLIDAGADVNAQSNNGWSSLIRAARFGRTETVNELLAAGADLSARTKDGDTALMLAAEYGHNKVVDILKQSGLGESDQI